MTSPFENLLDILRDSDQPVPLVRLSELSDLDRTEYTLLEGAWPEIPVERRRIVVDEVGQLADLHFEFVFERLNRLALTDPDAHVRRSAINNLWECEDPEICAPLLFSLTSDTSPEVRRAAATALGHFVYLGEIDEISEDLLHQVEDSLLATLAAEDQEDELYRRSLESLGYSSRKEVEALIQSASLSESVPLRRSALLAMGRSANKVWRNHVVHELNSPSPELREESARAAGELELHETVGTLVELLDDVDDKVRRASIWSLGQLGGEAAAKALRGLVERTDDVEENALLEDALDHLAFVDSTRDMLLFEFDDPEDPVA